MWMQKGRSLLYIHEEEDDNTRLQKGRSLLYIQVEIDAWQYIGEGNNVM